MDKYRIRRAILDELVTMAPVPSSFDALCELPGVVAHQVKAADVIAEIQGLVEHGYVADLLPGRGGLYRSTAAGRSQINRETDLDEYVWGEFASRFQSSAALQGK
jgi:hypothetical protein